MIDYADVRNYNSIRNSFFLRKKNWGNMILIEGKREEKGRIKGWKEDEEGGMQEGEGW